MNKFHYERLEQVCPNHHCGLLMKGDRNSRLNKLAPVVAGERARKTLIVCEGYVMGLFYSLRGETRDIKLFNLQVLSLERWDLSWIGGSTL